MFTHCSYSCQTFDIFQFWIMYTSIVFKQKVRICNRSCSLKGVAFLGSWGVIPLRTSFGWNFVNQNLKDKFDTSSHLLSFSEQGYAYELSWWEWYGPVILNVLLVAWPFLPVLPCPSWASTSHYTSPQIFLNRTIPLFPDFPQLPATTLTPFPTATPSNSLHYYPSYHKI